MTTLFDGVLALARKLSAVRTGTVDSGSTTTIVDALRSEVETFWKNGTALVIQDTGGVAPQGEWGRISAFVHSTGTATIDALTAAVAAGDKYAFIVPRYPLHALIDAFNAELTGVKYPEVDTSLTTLAATTEYTLPSGVFKHNLRQVWVQTNDDSVDNQWFRLRNWMVQVATTGSAHKLILLSPVDDGYTLKLVYVKYHGDLIDATDEINDLIPLERLLPGAAIHAIMNRLHFASGGDHEKTQLARFERQEIMAKVEHVVMLPEKDGRLKAQWA